MLRTYPVHVYQGMHCRKTRRVWGRGGTVRFEDTRPIAPDGSALA